jgi:hypothetical protein
MIGSVAPSHGSFGNLIRYQIDNSKCPEYETYNLHGENAEDLAGEMSEVVSEHNRLHPKGKDVTTPSYHISISWTEQDNPSREQMLEVGKDFLKHMGLDEHQSIVAIHKDKFYDHIHIVANRVHPDGDGLWEKYLVGDNGKSVQSDYQRVEEFLRETERNMDGRSR